MAVTGGIRARAGIVFVDVRPDLDGFQRTIASRTTTNKFSNAGRMMGKALLVGVAAAGVGAAFIGKLAVDAAIEAEKVMAQTDAVLKSTGHAANVSAKDVQALALEIMNYSGISDEAVQSTENLLLTFTNIENQAGKNNDIFNQSTKAAIDMSVALGQDTKSSAIQLGKALNDPIKGLTSLSRVGVAFTEGQRTQIAALVESGNVMGAQKIILRELTKEFGGSAKAAGDTFAGKVNLLKEQFGNLLEEIGFKLIPVLEDLTAWASRNLPGAFAKAEAAIGFVTRNAKMLAAVAGGVLAGALAFKLVNAIKAVNLALKANPYVLIIGATIAVATLIITNWDKIKAFLGNVWGWIRQTGANIWNALKDATGGILAFITGGFTTFVEFWFNVASAILTGAEKAFGWIPEIGERIRKFKAEFDRTTDGIVSDLRRTQGEFQGMGESAREQLGLTLAAWRRFKQGIEARVNLNIGGWSGEIGGGFGPSMGLVAVGHQLQRGGFLVGEHPAFGGVASVHAPGSYHYQGRALDINWPGAGETSKLNALGAALRASLGSRIKELFFPGNDPVGGHQSHLHLAMDRGGIVKGPATIHQGNIWEAHIPLTGSNALPDHRRLTGEGEFLVRNGKTYFRTTLREVLREP